MTRRESAEVDAYSRHLRWVLDQIVVSLEGLTPAQGNWRPDTGAANSAYGIVNHVIASTRVYALGFGCGLPVQRNRAEEFAAAGADPAGLIARVTELAGDIDAALAGLDPTTLDQRILPPRDLGGTGELHEISRREALVESLRHAGLHLGELRLTRDLASQRSFS